MDVYHFLGVIGCLLSFFVQLTPITTIFDDEKREEMYTQSYFLIGIIQSMLYAGFAYQNEDCYIFIASMTGIILFFAYLNYLIFVIGPVKDFFYFNSGLCLLFIVSMTMISKSVCLYLAVAMACYWNMLSIPAIRLALENRDTSFVNILLSYASLTNFLIWFLYGILVGNYLLSFQSTIAIIFMFTNIYIYHWALGKISDKDPYIVFRKSLSSESMHYQEEEYDLSEKMKGLTSDIFYRN